MSRALVAVTAALNEAVRAHDPHETARAAAQADRVYRERAERARAACLMLLWPSVLAQGRVIPVSYYAEHEGGVIVDCPCGRRPWLPPDRLVHCEKAAWIPGVRSSCTRCFVWHGGTLRVVGSPA